MFCLEPSEAQHEDSGGGVSTAQGLLSISLCLVFSEVVILLLRRMTETAGVSRKVVILSTIQQKLEFVI